MAEQQQRMITDAPVHEGLTRYALKTGLGGEVLKGVVDDGTTRYLWRLEPRAPEQRYQKEELVELGLTIKEAEDSIELIVRNGGVPYVGSTEAARELGVGRSIVDYHLRHHDKRIKTVTVWVSEIAIPVAEVQRLKREGLPNRGTGGRKKEEPAI